MFFFFTSTSADDALARERYFLMRITSFQSPGWNPTNQHHFHARVGDGQTIRHPHDIDYERPAKRKKKPPEESGVREKEEEDD